MEDNKEIALLNTAWLRHVRMNTQRLWQQAHVCTGLYWMPSSSERSADKHPFLTQKLSPIDNHSHVKISFFNAISLGMQTTLTAAPMIISIWTMPKELNGIF